MGGMEERLAEEITDVRLWRALLQLETWADGTWLVTVVDQRIARAVLKEWDERQACATCGGTGGAYDKWGHWLRCPNPDGIDEPVGGQQ